MRNSVCIIGGGASGVIGAKVLLSTGKFDVTLYEKANRIGGIWSQDELGSENSFLSPNTPLNVSRFNVGFSDHDWNSVCTPSGLVEGIVRGVKRRAPIFPKAWQANRYLQTFIEKHGLQAIIHTSHTVVNIERYEHEDCRRWRIVTSTEGQEKSVDFDYLVLASGFFSSPRSLSYSVPKVSLTAEIRALHSSQFRTLEQLFVKTGDAVGKTILIIGGGNSAGEVAAAVAQQLSNTRYSPDTGPGNIYEGTKIVHVTPRPIYALVPFVPANESSTAFIPWDLKMYDLSKRPAGPITGNAGRIPVVVKDMLHNALQATLGGDQADLGSAALQVPFGEPRWPVQVALSESYSEFVRSDLIEVVAGRVTSLEGSIAKIKGNERLIEVGNIGAVIYATGYTPVSGDFLPEDIKKAVQYDAESVRLPMILQGWQTKTPAIPELAMIGFYEGPFWPLMEMQARLAASRWIDGDFSDVRPFEKIETLLDLRRGMSQRAADIPQYWFGDYAGYMEEIASHLQLQRNDGLFAEREGSVSPARYLSADTDRSTSGDMMKELHKIWQDCTQNGAFVARAVFRALQGKWNIFRTIDSSLSSFPSGILEGTASFHSRTPTKDKSEKMFDFEYLYVESGTLKLSNGSSMLTRRRYVYRYSEERDQLSVWFVKPDSDFEVDYLFHDLTFVSPAEAEKAGACTAKADHLCIDDMYSTEYLFPMKAISLLEFTNTHRVKGPSKDYVATTTYRRPDKKAEVSQVCPRN